MQVTQQVQVHVVHTGWLEANGTFLRGEGARSLLRRARTVRFPVLSWVIDHPDGRLAVDTGLGAHIGAPRRLRGFPPAPDTTPGQELGPRLRDDGIDPAGIAEVVLTHLDWDHTGGLRHLPHARVRAHRTELEFARTRLGRARTRPGLLPPDVRIEALDLDDGPWGPFARSRALTADGRVRAVPLPGHSPGQIGVVVETGDRLLLLSADHALRADWLTEDLAAGRLVMLGPFAKRAARDTSRRLEALLRERPVVLLPSHDEDAPRRLAASEPTRM